MLTLTRTLHLSNPLTSGKDVTAVQQLLTAKGFPVIVDSWFGPETAAACVSAKRRLGYPKVSQTPTCGQDLVKNLEAHAPFPPPPVPAARTRYITRLHEAIQNKGMWDYSQSRPIPHPGHVGRIVTDCSGGVTYLAECAGVPDPNGRHFDGEGFTGTILNHCAQIPESQLKPGDLIVYGIYPGHHVVAALTSSTVWSHGHQGDPTEYSMATMAESQARAGHSTITYLRFLI